MPSSSVQSDAPEIGHVLFIDLVGYSLLMADEQPHQINQLQEVICLTSEVQRAQSNGELIQCPTGDGMALVFFRDPVAPVRCALEIARAVERYPHLRLRMGIHSDLIYRVEDGNRNINVAGSGINLAQRVMDFGDAGHILVSSKVAETLTQLTQWAANIHEFGTYNAKHGIQLRVYNVLAGGMGNPALPEKLRQALPLRSAVDNALLPADALSAFVAGPPVLHPRHFFGRERELKRLFNLLKRLPLQNAAIIGPRRSGKTSLLHYLKNIATTEAASLRPGQRRDWLSPQPAYHWVLTDFQNPQLATQAGLLRFLLTQLGLPVPTPCNLDRFLETVSRNLNSPTVILLDELDVALQRYPELDNAFWEGLRSLATNQVGGNLGFVLASHEPPDQLAGYSSLGSPFFNIFGYTAQLGPLTESEARELIASSPLPFADADTEWILAESACWPMLLQILCRERLLSLEEEEDGDTWREEGRRQMQPFCALKGIA